MKKIKLCFLFCFIFALYFSSIVWAKYETNQTYVAAILEIDRKSPVAEVIYKTKKLGTNVVVEVNIKANEILQNVEGWKLDQDKKILKKEYLKNEQEKIEIQDLAGNKTTINIKVDTIKK